MALPQSEAFRSTGPARAVFLAIHMLVALAACDGTRTGNPPSPSHAVAETEANAYRDAGRDPESPGALLRESAADGITAEEDALIPPGRPGTVSTSRQAEKCLVEWVGTGDDTILGYVVYRRRPGEEWEEIGRTPLHPNDERNRGVYLFEDDGASEWEYAVAAIAANGMPGPRSSGD